MSDLSAKQRQFVEEYMVDKNATQAAIRAGYSAKTACEQGSRLLANVKVRAAVDAGLERLAEKSEITAERVLSELAKLGFADLRKVFSGNTLIDVSDLPDDIAAAVTSVEIVTRPGDRDEAGNQRVEHVHKIRLADKRAALVDIGKHLGMFPTKVEHTGKDGDPIEYKDMTDLEIGQRVLSVFDRAANEETRH